MYVLKPRGAFLYIRYTTKVFFAFNPLFFAPSVLDNISTIRYYVTSNRNWRTFIFQWFLMCPVYQSKCVRQSGNKQQRTNYSRELDYQISWFQQKIQSPFKVHYPKTQGMGEITTYTLLRTTWMKEEIEEDLLRSTDNKMKPKLKLINTLKKQKINKIIEFRITWLIKLVKYHFCNF